MVITARCREPMEDYLAARTDSSPALFIGFHRPTQAQHTCENRLTADGARYICRHLARRLGLKRFSPHGIRSQVTPGTSMAHGISANAL